MFKIGDKVRFVGDYTDHIQEPSAFTNLTLKRLCEKYNNIFTIDIVYEGSKKYAVLEDHIWTFEEHELELYSIDAMDAIIYGITSQMQDEKGPSVECPKEIKCLPIELIKNEIPIFEPYWNKQKENNMEKILQLYKEKQTKLIEHKYDKQLEELEENDELRVYLGQATETVKSLLELEDEETVRIEIINPYVDLTPKTIQKREEIIKLIREEKAELNNKIEEIQALLELAPNYEEKIRILRDYGIIDKKKNIIL